MTYYESRADKPNYLSIGRRDCLTPHPHFHNAFETVIVLDGEIEVSVNGVKNKLVKGQGCLMHSLDVHYYNYDKEFSAFLLVAGDTYVKGLEGLDDFKSISTFFTVDESVITFVKTLAETGQNKTSLENLSNIALLFAKISANGKPIYERVKQNGFIIELFQYIHANYKKHISVESIAKEFGYSRGYVSTLFCDYTGERFNTYLNRIRVRSAKADLDKKVGGSVLDIAFANGFESANTFYRAYKNEYGEHPVRK